MTSGRESLGLNSPSTSLISGINSPTNTCNSDPGNLSSPPPSCRVNRPCFSCQQAGHWARKCPNRTPTARRQLHPGPPSSPPSAGPSSVVHCPCRAGICVVKVSRKTRSSGRKFYSCPLFPSENRCNFFKWCDELSSDDLTDSAPICKCTAGPCRVYQETDGPDAGRKFFVCPIKRGQGACDFRLLVGATDSHSNDGTTTTPPLIFPNCPEITSANSDFVVEGDSPKQNDLQGEGACGVGRSVDATNCYSDEGLKISGRALVLNVTIDGWDVPQSNPKRPTMVTATRASDLTLEPSRPQKRLFLGHISPTGSSSTGASSTSLCYNSPAMPSFLVQVTRNCLESLVHQILGFQFRGWYCQLLLPPSRSPTIPSPKPFFCCISPSLDPICDSRDVNVSNAEAAAIVPYSQSSAEPSKQSLLLEGPSCLKQPSKMLQGNEITEPIEEIFHKAAKQIQNKLIAVLELTDFRDHETMAGAASSVFRALDGLLDYQPFEQRVMEFVGTAASLAEAELSIQEDNSLQQLLDRYNCQKQHLENVSDGHAETASALEASTEHLESLRKEAAQVKAILRRMEEELLSCEAKNVEILNRFEQVNEEKLKSQETLKVAAMEVEEARKLSQKREAAEASFKAAKLKLQHYCLCMDPKS